MPETKSPPCSAESLRNLSDGEKARVVAGLSDAEHYALLYDWEFWARPTQLAPDWDWINWIILAGRGFGKTRCGAEQVRKWIRQGRNNVNLIAATADDLRDVMVEGESGILAICPRSERPRYLVSKRRLEWPNGSISLLFTAEEPDRLRGKQHQALWADEIAAWRHAEASWEQAEFGLRLMSRQGSKPQAVITTTPRPTALVKRLTADPKNAVTRGSTYDNKANLAPTFLSAIITKYEGTRLGRQELNAEILDDNPGALFSLANIDAHRIEKLPALSRIVVAIDPAVSTGEESDDTGIVVAGRDNQRPPHFYVFDDLTMQGKPNEWAKAAIGAYRLHHADRIVGEVNNGGDMIESTLRNVDADVSYKAVHATRGKAVRAEPVSALYEQGRVHHQGSLAKLEDELTGFDPTITNQRSPNRMDAMVWAITELMEGSGAAGLFGFYEAHAASQADTRSHNEVRSALIEQLRNANKR